MFIQLPSLIIPTDEDKKLQKQSKNPCLQEDFS